ncbi:MAG: hypothetical protein ACNA7Q_01720 [Rhodobacterales bacterium]
MKRDLRIVCSPCSDERNKNKLSFCMARIPGGSSSTQLINALRGHFAEFGLVAPKGPTSLKLLANAPAEESTDLPEPVRHMGSIYVEQSARLTEVIDRLSGELEASSRTDQQLRRLCTIPWIGPLTACAVAAPAPDGQAPWQQPPPVPRQRLLVSFGPTYQSLRLWSINDMLAPARWCKVSRGCNIGCRDKPPLSAKGPTCGYPGAQNL